MTVFLLLADDAQVEAKLRLLYPNDHRKIASGQWLVSAPLTPQGLSQQLDPERGSIGRHIVLPITSYYGWHDKDNWAWIDLKMKGGT